MTLNDKAKKLIRLAHASKDPELRRRAVALVKRSSSIEEWEQHTAGGSSERLPQEPHHVMQEALEDGTVAGEEEDESDDSDVPALTIFDDPSDAEKRASLNETDRVLVRMASTTKSPTLKNALLKLLRPES